MVTTEFQFQAIMTKEFLHRPLKNDYGQFKFDHGISASTGNTTFFWSALSLCMYFIFYSDSDKQPVSSVIEDKKVNHYLTSHRCFLLLTIFVKNKTRTVQYELSPMCVFSIDHKALITSVAFFCNPTNKQTLTQTQKNTYNVM